MQSIEKVSEEIQKILNQVIVDWNWGKIIIRDRLIY
jgi:hypothetical protein